MRCAAEVRGGSGSWRGLKLLLVFDQCWLSSTGEPSPVDERERVANGCVCCMNATEFRVQKIVFSK